MEGESGFVLSEAQRWRLLSYRAAWEEGEDEERLERLRQREEDAETVRAFGELLRVTGFEQGTDLTRAQMAELLALARALAPNPNLDSRLLRRPGEPESINQDLRALLFGQGGLVARLRTFLLGRTTASPVGGQTALQLLCTAYPETYPLITPAGLRALQLSPAQRRAARTEARARFDLPLERLDRSVPFDTTESPDSEVAERRHYSVPNNDPVLRILADLIVYEAVCELLEATDYIAVHRMLTRGEALGVKALGIGQEEGVKALGVRRLALGTDLEASVNAPTPQRPTPNAPTPTNTSNTHEYPTPNAQRPTPNAINSPSPPPYTPLVDLAGYSQLGLLEVLEREIAGWGYTYSELTIRSYYLSLQSKPFVLLAGLSGTGKTQLTALFAQGLTGYAGHLEGMAYQYRLLPVRPDWMDSSPIVGYMNMLVPAGQGRGLFVGTPFLEFVQRASRPENRDRLFLLCLDEMNLARVEHYFAEVLSAMETPTRELLLPDGRLLALPPNLFLTGTLNQDEATHSLSRKVLDRANTLTFQDVHLRELPYESESEPGQVLDGGQERTDAVSGEVTSEMVVNVGVIGRVAEGERGVTGSITSDIPFAVRQGLFLRGRVGSVAEARERLRGVSGALGQGGDFVGLVVNTLADVNGFLEPHGLHFAYRVRDEALRFCANSFEADGTPLLAQDTALANLRTALDLQLLQKVLPRLTGTQEQLETPILDLLRYAERQGFERTAHRLRRLKTILQRDGFAGFDAV